jgi:cytochrome c553
MKKIIILFSIAASIAVLIAACTKASEDNLSMPNGGNTNTCDTTGVSYSATVVPILQANCYSCHGTSTNAGSGGIVLEGYTNLKKWAGNGYLIGDITHATGFVAMPYNGGKLSDCDINQIQAWINQGTLNN